MSESRDVDWRAVKQRLQDSQRALERTLSADPARIQVIYNQRAEQLARRQEQAEKAPTTPMLVFWAGAERCGLELEVLAEVSPFANCALLPGAPPEVLGMTNQRGRIQPVVDLARLLGSPKNESSSPGYILWLRRQDHLVGLRAEQVEQIQQVALEKLVNSGSLTTDPSRYYLKGLTPDRVRLLDPEAILSHPIFKENAPA